MTEENTNTIDKTTRPTRPDVGHHLPNWLWCERCQAWIETQHFCGAQYIDRGDHYELVRPAVSSDAGNAREPLVDMILPLVYKAAKEPCRSYARGCPENQPDRSYWCGPCEAREVKEEIEANPEVVELYCLPRTPTSADLGLTI